MKENENMENMKNLNDNELNAAVGGTGWDFYTINDRLKMRDGTVCKCGHAVGTLRLQTVYGLLICEKCGEPIGIVYNQMLLERA